MPSSRSVRKIRTAISPRFATRTFEKAGTRILSLPVRFADQLTVARILAAPLVVLLFVWDFDGHDYWATAVFVAAISTDWLDGRIARRGGYGTELGPPLGPIADKVLVLSSRIVLSDADVFPAWMVAAIVAREFSSPDCGSQRSSAAWSSRLAT